MTTPFPFVSGAVLTAAQMNAITEVPVSAKTASYTLAATDAGSRITMSSASATTITVNTGLFSAGQSLRIQNLNGGGVCTVTAGTATVTSAGPLALVAWAGGQLYFTSASAAVWFPDAVTASSFSQAIFREEQASGTYGGGSTSGSYQTRVLNTTVVNNISGCSLATNQVTLPAGSYYAVGITPVYGGNAQFKNRLQNITDGTTIGIGTNQANGGGAGDSAITTIEYYFTLATSKAIALQTRVTTSVATDGLGNRCNFGDTEVYAQLTITKVA